MTSPKDCPTPVYHETHRYCPSCTWTEMDLKKPLTCGFCGAKRFNDMSVVWLPLAGDRRRPYCAKTCGRWVMTAKADFPNEVVLPELFKDAAGLEDELAAMRLRLKQIVAAASGSRADSDAARIAANVYEGAAAVRADTPKETR